MATNRVRARGVACGAALGALLAGSLSALSEDTAAPAAAAARVDGRELFVREWVPGDKRSHGGDGLGPLFNESSCVACHNQGGVGGGGPAGKNAQILTAFPNPVNQRQVSVRHVPAPVPRTLPEQLFRGLFGTLDVNPEPPPPVQTTRPLPVNPTQAAPRRVAVEVSPDGTRTERIVVANDAAFEPAAVTTQAVAAAPSLTLEQLAQIEKERKNLGTIHPGLANSPSVVLHRSGTYAEYQPWRTQLTNNNFRAVGFNTIGRQQVTLFESVESPSEKPGSPIGRPQGPQGIHLMQTVKQEIQLEAQRRTFHQAQQQGNFAIVRSERNTTALFGAGLIDSVTDDELRALEAKQSAGGPISGRVAALKDGRIGRFGWKGQIAHLDDFVLTACAVELGLNVPGHSQAGIPHRSDYKPTGLDLNAEECRALVNFVRDLPAPTQRDLGDEHDAAFVEAGAKLFAKVGCAECHVRDVGKAVGIYSDLLLHDMGPDLGDSGSSYGINLPDATPEGQAAPQQAAAGQTSKPAPTGATRQEWRTAPLWGVRDSGPYLHDGRAETFDQAIALHGGESTHSAQQYFSLKPEERFQVVTFLKSLVAPETKAVATR